MEHLTIERAGQRIGYVFAYALFTTSLFFILAFLHKIPAGWGYLHILSLTLVTAILGSLARKWLA